MSKLLTGLMEAEQKRRQLAGKGASPGNAAPKPEQAAEHLPATQRRQLEERHAARQASDRAAAALRSRIAAEQAALAAAQDGERAATELSAAAAARMEQEAELSRMAGARAIAEALAADRAAEQLRIEQAAKDASLARATEEERAAQEMRRRAEQEIAAEAAVAERARAERLSESALRERIEAEQRALAAAQTAARTAADHQKLAAELAAARASAPGLGAKIQQGFGAAPAARANRCLLAATALALMVGIGAGVWLGKPPAAVSVRPLSVEHDRLQLRLDHRLSNPPPEQRDIPRDKAFGRQQ